MGRARLLPSRRQRLSRSFALPGWISSQPLSTAGAGVSWLHVRLDDHPKYYSYEPYQQDPE
jgi:hypothetical protein